MSSAPSPHSAGASGDGIGGARPGGAGRPLSPTASPGGFVLPGRHGRPAVPVHVAAPPVIGPATRVVVVLHGTERNAAEYLVPWQRWALYNDCVVLAPHFDRVDWPGAHGYVLGAVLDRHGEPLPRSRWAFTAITELHRHIRARLGLADPEFDLWGHSAGAQFVHRYLLFAPTAPVRTAIAANAGWYTRPDQQLAFPYGLRHPALEFSAADVAAWVARPLVLMAGTADIDRDGHLRTTPEADDQGPHRYARAVTMLRAGRRVARACRWRLVAVPGASHDFTVMAAAAQALLVRPRRSRIGRGACVPSG